MKTDMEIQNENVQTLIKLIKENPELRIVPIVDSKIVASDGFSTWLGSFGEAEIDYVWDSGERVYFNSHDEEELIQDELDDIDPEIDDSIAEAAAVQRVSNFAWEKVIVVWIGLP